MHNLRMCLQTVIIVQLRVIQILVMAEELTPAILATPLLVGILVLAISHDNIMPQLKISDLNLLFDSPSWTIHDNFEKFYSNNEPIAIQCSVVFSNSTQDDIKNSTNLFNKGIRSVYTDNEKYYIFYNEKDIPSCIEVSENWTKYKIYINPSYNNPYDEQNINLIKDALFTAMRNIMVSSLIFLEGVLVHSVTIDWNGKGILFSAPSGTGKSTHANLWHKKYDVKIIDGDVTSCRIVDGLPVIYGLPWCGTSGEFINTKLQLGAIIFLEQSEDNSIIMLDPTEAIVRLYARCFLLIWEEKMADLVLDTITKIVLNTECYLLKCRPDFEAVELVKRCLEKKDSKKI